MDQALADIGVISAYRFVDDGSATKLDVANLDAELADPQGWLWLHFNLSNRRCHDWLAKSAPLSDVARETLLDPDEHIRLDIFGDEIAGVLPDLHQEFMQEGDDLVRMHFAISSKLMITARRKPLRAIELTRRTLDGGRKFRTPVSLFDAIVDQFADVIGRYSAGLGDELDIVENHVLHDEIDDERLRLGRVRLQAIRTRRQLSQIRALFHRMETREDIESETLLSAMRKLAQKFDALDYEFSAHLRARAAAAGRDRRPHDGDHQPPPVHAVGPDRVHAALDAGHRLLRHEHQGHAVPERRRRHLVRVSAGDRRGRTDLVAAQADQGAVAAMV